MAKTATAPAQPTFATKTIDQIAEEFALISDSGSLRYHQARLTYLYVGDAEGKDATELKENFAKHANEALRRHNEATLSVPGVTNLVNTWKYLRRANVDTNEQTNPQVYGVAKAAFNLASQSFRKKEENYVIPAIEAILNGADAEATFIKQTAALKADKKADADQKGARGGNQKDADEAITFDSIVAVLQVIPTLDDLSADEKATLRDLLANAAVAVAE